MPAPKQDAFKAEEFPALGANTKPTRKNTTRRSSSALSSVSTTSIGAFNQTSTKVTWKLNNGNYLNMAEIFVRPHLSCWCVYCQDKSSNRIRPDYLKECDWEGCEKARRFEAGHTLRVTDSKVVRHRVKRRTQKFSVAFVEIEDGENGFRGWVRSKNLKRRQIVKSEEALWDMAMMKHAEEADRSRSPSVCSSSSLPPPLFKFRELVLCQKDGAWVRAVVHCEHPLKVMIAGSNELHRVRFCNVKKHPARKYVTLEDVEVRSVVAKDNWGSEATLKKGTVVQVAECKGFEGRITAPVCGWISMRTKHSLNVVEQGYAFTQRNPTMLIKNIPGSLTECQLKAMIQQNALVTPTSIQFQQNGDQFRAVVQFRHHEEGTGLVELGEVNLDGEHRLVFSWEMNYLRSRSVATAESKI